MSRTSRFSSVRVKSITVRASTRVRGGPPMLPPARGRRGPGSRDDCAPYTRSVDTNDASDALDLAALAGPNMSPVLGRYMDRSWSHGIGHRLYDTSGRAYLDFANGIAVTALGHAHPRVTAAIHAQVDRLMGPVHAIGFAESTVRLARMLADTFPDPLDTVLFLNSGSEAIDGAIKLARRVTGRPAILAFRGAFHGRTIGATSVTSSSLNYRLGYEPLLPSIYQLPYPAAYRDFDDDEAAATRDLPRAPRRPLRDHRRPVAGRRHPHRARPGRGRLLPGPGGLPPGAARGLRRARDPAHRRRGPVGLRPHRRDVGVRARGHRPGRGVRGQGHRQRPAAVRDRGQQGRPGALGTRRARHHVRRQPRGLCGRRRGARDDPRRGPGGQRPPARRRADRRPAGADGGPSGASATCAGRG